MYRQSTLSSAPGTGHGARVAGLLGHAGYLIGRQRRAGQVASPGGVPVRREDERPGGGERHDRALQAPGEEEGVPFGRILVARGASERLSPILMIALATALALVPLIIYGDQPGQGIEYPVAIVIIGSLAASTLLSLLALPPPCLLIAGWRRSARPAPCA